ncbi:polysaccharide deacetylase family protein [Caloranaerobacter azorensis]|uniref:Polysaccharide deacetylase n=2 Tax=Caloranaerobacter azorensis TaxID=116090 RepID=A0A096BI22_9FIRM|nr:polysaccharide deacetylase family protein [Caloranaerobacter azorensis]KGG80855.1 polysaccharide deacetylase [Caloranaerobacter azorensis H53214]QIB26142.1 polysaccharide deacetylase family protein [Caloranaerobacter azorensis]
MKIYYIKYGTIKKFFILLLIIITILVLLFKTLSNNSTETFNNDDIFYKGNIDEKIIAFACNVDWGNEYIKPMLNIFDTYDIKITFFVTGRWAKNNSRLLKEIYSYGHEIGNHGYLHKDYSKLNYESNKKQILEAEKIIYNTIGVKPKYFAPPSGAYNKYTVKAAKDLNYKTIMWSIDTIDWRNDSTKEKIIERVISKSHNSAIVLMHPKRETIKALPVIIETLKKEGYKIGRISDIIKN